MKVSADGAGVASHAGTELLRELAAATGLVGAWDKALIGTYSGLPFHFPGQVLADLAVSIAEMCIRDRANRPSLIVAAMSSIATLTLFGSSIGALSSSVW